MPGLSLAHDLLKGIHGQTFMEGRKRPLNAA
jgi:hypothetical protein